MKTLVTHINPHLDDIAAIWLFKKFHPEFKTAEIKFLKAKSKNVTFEDKGVDSNPEVIHFGIGRGKYDEHKGDVLECATSLVWKDVESNTSGLEKEALARIIEWVRLEDTGKLPVNEYYEFSVPAFIRPDYDTEGESKGAVQLGEKILDKILDVLKKKEQAKRDWEGRVEFETKFGKTVAVKSATVNRTFCKAHQGDLFLIYDPKTGYVQFFTPSLSIDLEPIYKKVASLDPEADWYLHHSHHMVICGSGTAPDSKKTKLNFEDLIEVAKSI